MGKPLPLTTLIVLAVFAATGGIVWLAYGETGSLQGEPPLIRASATPLKRAPDDPGGRKVAELGGVGELLVDQPDASSNEQLMPAPEQPLSPAEAAVARLSPNGLSEKEELAPDPAKRDQAMAALKQLVDGLRSDGATTPSGVGGPPDTVKDWRLSPARPKNLDGGESNGIAQPRRVAEAPRNTDGNGASTRLLAGIEVAATGDVSSTASAQHFQAASNGRFRVQLAAVREEDDAKHAWSQFRQQLGAYVGGLEPFFERAETGNGTFYRVQVGPFADSGNAEALCVELKKQDTSCFVVTR